MTRLRISQEAQLDILVLVKRDLPELERLAAALQQRVPVKLSIDDEIAIVITECFPDDTEEERRKITSAIISLYIMFVASQSGRQVFIDNLVEALRYSTQQTVLDGAKAKFSLLLGVSSIQIATKAWSLLEEQEKIFVGSRLMTDLRPVFGDSISPPLAATIITHTLRVSYRSDSRGGSFYVVADDDDLRTLRANIDRALEKSRILRAIVKNYPDRTLGDSIEAGSENEG